MNELYIGNELEGMEFHLGQDERHLIGSDYWDSPQEQGMIVLDCEGEEEFRKMDFGDEGMVFYSDEEDADWF